MSGGAGERSRLMDSPIEWPPPPHVARAAGLTVAALADGDTDAARDVLDALGLREVL